MESSSWSLPYSAFRPTSSTSWRCFSTRRFLKYATRSFLIEASPSLLPGFEAADGRPSPSAGGAVDALGRPAPPRTVNENVRQHACTDDATSPLDRQGRRVAPQT